MYLRDTGNKAKNTVVISMHCASSLLINQILKKIFLLQDIVENWNTC